VAKIERFGHTVAGHLTEVAAIGDRSLLKGKRLGLFCLKKCPGELILKRETGVKSLGRVAQIAFALSVKLFGGVWCTRQAQTRSGIWPPNPEKTTLPL
jgi:hypothetical protein